MAATAVYVHSGAICSIFSGASGPTMTHKLFPATTSSLACGVRLKSMPRGVSFLARASDPENEGINASTSSTSFEEDFDYLLKLTAGSIAGAAAIKYGSILLPDITKPNLVLALLMISTPMVVAILLLLKESSKE